MDGLVALGSGGAALLGAFTLLIGVRAKNKIKIDKEHVPYWAFGVGLLAAGAGSALSKLGTVGDQLNSAFQQAHGIGEWKTGATATLLILLVFGLKARPWKDSICGAVAPSVFMAAGGLWALPVTIFGALIRALLGA